MPELQLDFVEQVEEIPQGFIEYPNGPVVEELPAGGGRRVKTYVHFLGGETELGTSSPQVPPSKPDDPDWKTETNVRPALLESDIKKALTEINRLKAELGLNNVE